LRALFPDARLSLPVAGKSCIAAGEGDGSGDLDSAIGIRYDHGVEDLGEKEAVLAANPDAFFTIPHFDGYSAVLILGHTPAFQVYQARGPALRFSKGTLANWSGGRVPALPGGRAASSARQAPAKRGNGGYRDGCQLDVS
jgi:hypothetical protein